MGLHQENVSSFATERQDKTGNLLALSENMRIEKHTGAIKGFLKMVLKVYEGLCEAVSAH